MTLNRLLLLRCGGHVVCRTRLAQLMEGAEVSDALAAEMAKARTHAAT